MVPNKLSQRLANLSLKKWKRAESELLIPSLALYHKILVGGN